MRRADRSSPHSTIAASSGSAPAAASYVVTLPGTHKLKTLCNLVVGDHALRVEAFVMRQPDENREQLWAWLLQRNARHVRRGVLHRRGR